MSIITYIQNLWSGLTSATADTVEWFQQIGNAVASAIGNVLYTFFRPILDFLMVIGALMNVLTKLFLVILAPFNWIFQFAASFYNNLSITTPVDNPLDDTFYVILEQIPFFPTLIYILLLGFFLMLLRYVLKTFQQ